MKNIKDYLHLYFGCNVKVTGKEYIDGSYIGKLIGFMDKDTLLIQYKGGDAWTPENKCKTILRPLSDMTEEEIFEVNRIDIDNSEMERAEEVRYLLSKHFDLFGLIEAGLAIDKTTIKQTTV